MAHAIRGYKNQKRIMKKEYIKPEMVVEEFVSEVYMSSVSNMPFNPDEEVEGGDANDRRGTWGNLWD